MCHHKPQYLQTILQSQAAEVDTDGESHFEKKLKTSGSVVHTYANLHVFTGQFPKNAVLPYNVN